MARLLNGHKISFALMALGEALDILYSYSIILPVFQFVNKRLGISKRLDGNPALLTVCFITNQIDFCLLGEAE